MHFDTPEGCIGIHALNLFCRRVRLRKLSICEGIHKCLWVYNYIKYANCGNFSQCVLTWY